MTDMTDEELIGYARFHADTPRALFSVEHARRLVKLAGMEGEYEIPEKGFVSIRNYEHPELMRRLGQIR